MNNHQKNADDFASELDALLVKYRDSVNIDSLLYLTIQTATSISFAISDDREESMLSLDEMLNSSIKLAIQHEEVK